jgi:hypothetical protein
MHSSVGTDEAEFLSNVDLQMAERRRFLHEDVFSQWEFILPG